MTFSNYRSYCNLTNQREGRYDVLKQFFNDVDEGKLVKCDCCGDYFEESHMVDARYDHDKLICEDCRENGN